MSKRTLWRLIVVAVICGACAFFFYPFSKVRLGLDLRGGVHFELEVQGHEALEADLRDTRDMLTDRLKEKGFPTATVKLDGKTLRVEGFSLEQQRPDIEKVLSHYAGYDIAFDAKGAILTQKPAHQQALKEDANKRAQTIIENRINQFGVAEPEITPSGAEGNRIVVELPGVGEAERERIKNLLQSPGRLELRLLAKGSSSRGYPTREMALEAFGGQLPPETELIPEPEKEFRTAGMPPVIKKDAAGQEIMKAWYLLETKVQFDGSSITNAYPARDPQTEAYQVHFTLDKKGAEANEYVSGVSVEEGRLFSFVLDRKVVSTLSAREKIFGNSVMITGRFSKDEVEDFSLKLKSGAMRASMKFLEERAVGPSLGTDSILAGLKASAVGFIAILVFMVFWYRWSGINAIVALTVNIIIMLGLLGSFHAVLTLPGIAGFALTVGMAVDANVLIFERIREELGLGKSVPQAIQVGFDRVFWTIVDSHVTQLFSALLLFIFGTGPVKGFAVTLTVGVVASLFTSIYISRYIYDWILERYPNTKTLSI